MPLGRVGRTLGGKSRRRGGSRVKSTRKKARPVVVKLKIKGTLKQVQNAAKELAEGGDDDVSESLTRQRASEQT